MVAVWMAIQLALTSLPGRAVPDLGFDPGDIVHFTMYAILGMLITRAGTRAGWPRARFPWVWPAIAVFALADELHQLLIPGRAFEWTDWLCDVAGGAAGLWLGGRLVRAERFAWMR